MGTIRFWVFVSDDGSFSFASSAVAFGGFLYSSSGGISSGGGIGIPRAAAMSWCSVHESE